MEQIDYTGGVYTLIITQISSSQIDESIGIEQEI